MGGRCGLDQSSDDEVEVEVAVIMESAVGACVGTAEGGFKLVDDFNGLAEGQCFLLIVLMSVTPINPL